MRNRSNASPSPSMLRPSLRRVRASGRSEHHQSRRRQSLDRRLLATQPPIQQLDLTEQSLDFFAGHRLILAKKYSYLR